MTKDSNGIPPGLLDIGRRPFLKGAAALAAASTVSFGSAAEPATDKYDVIVIGGGTVGMPLAIIAANRGAKVLVIDKSPVLGGTLDRSQASTSAGGTKYQKDAGIQDTVQDHFADVMRSNENTADPALVKLWTDEAPATVDWLVAHGVKFSYHGKMPTERHPIYGKPRVQMAEGGGPGVVAALTPALKAMMDSGRVTVKLNSSVVRLIQDATGAVTGVVVKNSDESAEEFSGRNVVIATGGCHGNASLFQTEHNVPLYYAAGYSMNTGDGLLLGQSVGGYVRGGDKYVPIFGIVMEDDAIPSSPTGGSFMDTTLSDNLVTHLPWDIWVNSRGERFVDEDSELPQRRERALGRQPGHRLWSIHDQLALDSGPSPMQGWDMAKYKAQFGKNPMFYKADTLEQLGVMAGINPRAMRKSVEDYNSALKKGQPDRLGRTHRPAPIEKGPFYAVRYQGFHLLTFAGLAVDAKLRVIGENGHPIANLYAAGEVLGAQAVGGSGHASGSMVTSSVAFAKLLGERFLNL